MLRRLFLVETSLKDLVQEIQSRRATIHGVYNIVETFIENLEDDTLTQLLSVFELQASDREALHAKAVFGRQKKSSTLVKLGERQKITQEEYYELLLGSKQRAVEPKARIVFTCDDVRYSLESNTERNYSVVQADYRKELNKSPKELFEKFQSVEVLGELYMSLEETFARLHLDDKPAGSLHDAVAILRSAARIEANKKAEL